MHWKQCMHCILGSRVSDLVCTTAGTAAPTALAEAAALPVAAAAAFPSAAAAPAAAAAAEAATTDTQDLLSVPSRVDFSWHQRQSMCNTLHIIDPTYILCI